MSVKSSCGTGAWLADGRGGVGGHWRVGEDIPVGAVSGTTLRPSHSTEGIWPIVFQTAHRKGLLIVFPLPALHYKHAFLSKIFNY